MVALVKKIEPSVVSIIVQRKYTTTINGQTITDYDRQVGSGVVWNKNGYILTTAGMAHQAGDILVSFSDGQYRQGTLVGIDPLSNIAVIHVDSVSVTAARIGNSDDVSPGAWVFMLSHAYGNPSSMSFGLVNGIRQEDVLLQVSAVVNTGFTGGAVFATNGRLIGLVADEKAFQSAPKGYPGLFVFGSSGSGAISVIPVNRIKTFANHLVEYGEIRRSWLGVYVEKIWDSVNIGGNVNIVVGGSDGMDITYVYDGSPARQAGLQVGDRLLEVNGVPMTHPIILAEFVTTMPVGAQIEIKYLRNGQELVTHTSLAAMPSQPEERMSPNRIPTATPDAVAGFFMDPDQFQQWIEDHERELEEHQMEIERIRQLWQERMQQTNGPSEP